MRVVFAPHARDMMAERAIQPAWVEDAVRKPDRISPDPRHAERLRHYKAIPERGGRVLRVVCIPRDDEFKVVTVFFDRGATR